MSRIPKILVVGSINMDICMEIPRFPAEGESVVGIDYRMIPGGKGANQAVSASQQDASVYFLGKVGADPYGAVLRKSLEDKGIYTNFMDVDPEVPSGLAPVMVDESGKNRIIVFLASNARISTEQLERAFNFMEFDAMMIQFEVSQPTVLIACKLASQHNIPIILDAGPAVDFPLEELPPLEILTPNETEALKLCGIDVHNEEDADRAARSLYARNHAKYVVIKMGSRGALLFDGEKSTMFPSTPVHAVDPTAAGDAFTGAMTVEYLVHGDIVKAIVYANQAGAITVTRWGAQTSIPTRKEVTDFAAQHNITL